MKKNIIVILILFILNNISYGEKLNFRSIDFNQDYALLVSFKELYEYRQDIWVKTLMNNFPLDDNGIIHLEYVIKCDTTFNIDLLMESSVNWFNLVFTDASNSISRVDKTEKVIIGDGYILNVAQISKNYIGYAKVVNIHIPIDIIIKFKENRIKIEVLVRHYKLISGDSFGNGENKLLLIKDAYPVTDSDNKVSFRLAFINSYANAFAMVKRYIDYINTPLNYKNDENW